MPVMTDLLTLMVGVLCYAVLWAFTLGAFRPLSMERSGIYILVTGLGAGLVFGADRFAYDGMALHVLARMLAESAYLALVLFLRSVRLNLSRRQEVLGSVLVLLASLLHLGLNVTLTGLASFGVMAVQIVLLYAWVLREAVLLRRAQPNGMTKMLVILVSLHLTFETVARGAIGYHLLSDPLGVGAQWQDQLNAWLWVTFSIGYVVLTAVASVLMDAFRTDKFKLEQVVQKVEGRLRDKESALLSLLVSNAEREKDPGVASLAHELRQPLYSIQLNAEYLTSGKSVSRAEEAEILQAILRENRRAAELVQSLRNIFVNKVPELSASLDLSAWLTDWAQAHAPDLRKEHGIALQWHVQADVHVQAQAAQLAVVLQNLLTNAVQALAQQVDGQIDVCLVSHDRWAQIDVIDNGPGLAPGTADQVFDMGFTTKEQGMGFGLWLSQRIAQMHGGELVCMPAAQGAHLRFILPLTPA